MYSTIAFTRTNSVVHCTSHHQRCSHRRFDETAANDGVPFFGKISKRRVESSDGNQESRQDIFFTTKKCKMDETKVNKLHSLSSSDMAILDSLINLPVVVCVSMYRTNGALENNVKLIGRREGYDLWHFC
jgi:5-methylcytosine-specific restriction endonuclease McrBC regulatory subunit McrC